MSLHIAVGILRRGDQVLISQRRAGKPGAGQWEFPGGKCEAGEAVDAALRRELHEELGVTVDHAQPLIQLRHRYPDRVVLLDTWLVDAWTGEPTGREGQAVRWTAVHDLPQAGLLEADVPIVTALRLPSRYAFTEPHWSAAQASEAMAVFAVEQAGGADPMLLRLRLPGVNDEAYRALVTSALAGTGEPAGGRDLDAPRLAVDRPALDWSPDTRRRLVLHLTSQALAEGDPRQWQGFAATIASCHAIDEIARAESVGIDALVVGPVQDTPTHPDAAGLGWSGFQAMVRHASRPVFAIGGVGRDSLAAARAAGATGVAGIRGFLSWSEA